MDFELGQIVKLKKQHPCGTNRWEVVRTGADFKVRCTGCDRVVMMPRTAFEKSYRGDIK